MAGLTHLLNVQRKLSVFKVVAPQDGGWSLTPMENLLRGLRGDKDVFVFEIFGRDGVVAYRVRTNNADGLSGMFRSYFPQARLDSKLREPGDEPDVDDWIHLEEDELGMVVPLFLKRPSYLPLRIFDDRTIEQSTMDPLAGVIGVLSTSTRQVGVSAGGDRLGLRLILRPAKEEWGAPWQKKMQQRRDGEDRAARPGSAENQGPSLGTIGALAGIAGIAAGNWWLYNGGNIGGMVGFNAFAALLGAAGIYGFRKYNAVNARRPYLDEELVDSKLKSLGFHVEMQLVRVYRSVADATVARDSLLQLIECLRSFDDPAGNSWLQGRVRSYSGQRIFQGEHVHPFVGGSQEMSWLEPDRAKKTVLSARESASLWHPPLGADEMAPMERTAAGILVPFLADLSQEGMDSGPLVGMAGDGDLEIYLPESSLRKHALIIGKSGVGKSTIIKHVLSHKLDRKAQGLDDGAIVVIDPHADLVRDTLKLVPESIAHKVRLLDFGRMDRVPGINLVDPKLFPDRDRCVDTIVNTVKHLWEHWGGRLEDLLKRSLSIIYEFNSHPETKREEMLTMLDILLLLDDGVTVGSGPNAQTVASNFQKRVLSRVTDPRLKQWFDAYLKWGRETRSEAVGPVHSRVGAYASDMRASVIMGQRESTIMLSDVLSEGLVLLVSTAQGTIGVQPAALMGGTMVSLVEAAMREQEKIDPSLRSKCMLVCDEFQTVTGANWEGMLAEIRKYGGSLVLATQSLARLDTPERKLKAGILGNIGVILAYQMAAEDAHIIAPEMDSERVQDRFLVNANPHNCYARITSDTKVYPAFSMSTLPPPDVTRGTTRAVDAVLEASKAYTVDWQDARQRLNEEVDRQLSLSNKIEGPGGESGSGSGGGGGGGRGGPGGGRGGDPGSGSGGGARGGPGGGRGGGGRGSEGRGPAGSSSGGEEAGGAGAGEGEDGSAPKATLDRLEELLEQRRDLRGRRPGSAFEDAKARGEAPFSGPDDALGSGDRVVVDDKIMAGPFRGFRQADVDSSNLGDELKKTLLNMANHDPFMRKLLDRREQSRKDGERLKVRQEEREKVLAEAKMAVADEVREEVRAEAMVELQPDMESMDVLKERARFEVMAELQEERKGIDEERAFMERERVRIREEEQANVRREMMMNVIGGGEVPAGDGGGVAVAERVAVEPVSAAGGGDDGAGGDGGRDDGGDDDGGDDDGEGSGVVGENGNGHVAGVPGRSAPEGEPGLFDDGGGLVLFDANDFGAYEGPDDAASGNGPVKVEPVAVVGGGDSEGEMPGDGRGQRPREEWLTVLGVDLPEGLVVRQEGEDSTAGVMDREAIEGYIAGLGLGDGGAVEKRENVTRESEVEKSGAGEGALVGHVSNGEGSEGGGVDGGLSGTRDSDDAALAGGLEVEPDGNGSGAEAGPAGVAGSCDGDADPPDSGPESDVEPVVIPQVVWEGGDLDEGLGGGDAPELSDVLSDIGQDSLEQVGRYGPKPLRKFYRRSESGGDTG